MLKNYTRVSVLRFGAPLALVAATAALIGLEELRLAVVGPELVEVRGTPLAGPWIPSPATGRMLLPVAKPGDSNRILAMVSTDGFESARELLGAEKAVRIRGFARQPTSDELAEISRAVKAKSLHLDPGFTVLETGTGRAALPAAIILFAAGAIVLASGASGFLTAFLSRLRQLLSRTTPMKHTSPEEPEDPRTPVEPEALPCLEPGPGTALEAELEPPIVTLDAVEGSILDGIEPLDVSGAAVSRLARSLALSTLASMRFVGSPLSEEAKLDIHRRMQEIWDRA